MNALSTEGSTRRTTAVVTPVVPVGSVICGVKETAPKLFVRLLPSSVSVLLATPGLASVPVPEKYCQTPLMFTS